MLVGVAGLAHLEMERVVLVAVRLEH